LLRNATVASYDKPIDHIRPPVRTPMHISENTRLLAQKNMHFLKLCLLRGVDNRPTGRPKMKLF